MVCITIIYGSNCYENDMNYKPEHVASKIPLDQHEYQGWFWHMATKKFYRWNDLPLRKEGINEKFNK